MKKDEKKLHDYWDYEEEYNEKTKKVLFDNYNKRVYSYFLDLIKTPSFIEKAEFYKKKYLSKEYKVSGFYMIEFCELFGFDPNYWSDIFYDYITKGILPKPNQNYSLPVKLIIKSDKSSEINYPVGLAISSFATGRDIKRYIDNFFESDIEPILKQHNSKFIRSPKNTKRKDDLIRQRNDFIYNHRHLPRKEIASLVAEKFHIFLDVGLIGKIISDEKKKREKK